MNAVWIADKADNLAKYVTVLAAFAVTFSTSLTALSFTLIGLFWLLSGNWRTKYEMIVRQPAVLGGLALLALVFVGLFHGPATLPQALRRLDSYVNSLLFLAIFSTIITEDKWRKRVFVAFVAGMAMTLVLADLTVPHLVTLPFGNPKRGEVFQYYTTQNYFMAIAVYATFVWYLYRKDDLTRAQKVLILAAVVLGAINIFFVTAARTGPIVLSAMFLTFLIDRYRLKGILIGLVAMIIVAAMAYTFSGRFNDKVHESIRQFHAIETGGSHPLPGRAKFFIVGTEIVHDYPFVGVGTGGLDQVFRPYEKQIGLRPHHFATGINLHSSYMMVATELGLTGLIVFLVFIGATAKQLVRLPEPRRTLGIGIVAGFAICSFVNAALINVNEGQMLALLVGSLIGGSAGNHARIASSNNDGAAGDRLPT